METVPGDEVVSTRQDDDTFNVVMDIKGVDGVRRFVANVIDPDAYYEKVRAEVDNPIERDLVEEKEILLNQKAAIENRIAKVDAEIARKGLVP